MYSLHACRILLAAYIVGVVLPAVAVSGAIYATPSPRPAAGSDNAQVLRSDRFRLRPQTRICIQTTVAQDVRSRVEASEERVEVASLTGAPVRRISERFRDLGWSLWTDGGARRRVLSYVETLGDTTCLERADNIIVRQLVTADGSLGYRVTIDARQGARRFLASVSRPRLISLPIGRRRLIPLDADRDPASGMLFWDVVHDAHRLQARLVDHIFAGWNS